MAKLNFYDTEAILTMKRSVRTTGSTATRKPISK